MGIKGVADWVQGTADVWARENRSLIKRSAGLQGTLGRVQDEGAVGAAIRGDYGSTVPHVQFSSIEVRRFHNAWRDLDVKERQHVWVHYVEHGTIKAKIEALQTSKRKYYDTLREALNDIRETFHLYEAG